METQNCSNFYGKGCPWDEMTCWRAAEYGHLECLKYAHENDVLGDQLTCESACYWLPKRVTSSV